MKIQKCLQKILILLVFLIAANSVKAQNDCTTADTLTSNYWSEYQFQDNQYYWLKFTADTLDYLYPYCHEHLFFRHDSADFCW